MDVDIFQKLDLQFNEHAKSTTVMQNLLIRIFTYDGGNIINETVKAQKRNKLR